MTRAEFIERYVIGFLATDSRLLPADIIRLAGEAHDTIHASDAKQESGWVSFAKRVPTAEDSGRGLVVVKPCQQHDQGFHHKLMRWTSVAKANCPNCRWLGLAEK